MSKLSLAELLAKQNERKKIATAVSSSQLEKLGIGTATPTKVLPKIEISDKQILPIPAAPMRSLSAITLNAEQLRAVELAKQGNSFCLIGAAGTGKTTTIQAILQAIKDLGLPCLRTSTSYLRAGLPPVALTSYTNRAVKNIAKACKDTPEMQQHCITIHKLLEFAPTWYEVEDLNAKGGTRKTMRFEPQFHAGNPITELRIVDIDESSMCDTRLFKQLSDACPNATFIFVGDLNQLPPVFGDAILGFKLLELEVVELKQVYRQAMESPIIAFQHNYTLKGIIPGQTELEKISAENKGLTFQFEKSKEADPNILNATYAYWFFNKQYKAGLWNPEEDIILMPYNKGFGTLGLNQGLAQLFGEDRCAVVHHIVSGRENKYLAVGDLITYAKEEWEILSIATNGEYFGKMPNPASQYLNRKGRYKLGHVPSGISVHGGQDLEKLLDMLEKDDLTRQASHVVTIKNKHTGAEESLTAVGDINSIDFAYCTTIHKSQGSEWRKVYLIMTNYHSSRISRELLYTGMTRAREELHCIASPNTAMGKKDGSLQRAIKRSEIPGIGWRQKAEYFKGKQKDFKAFMET